MKKALVLSLVLALGLGLTAFAQAWEGEWDTDISVRPAATTFGDFVQGFDSDLDVTYTIADWVFGVAIDFDETGMDGLDFGVDGALGAFTIDVDLDFEPKLYAGSITTFVGLVVDTLAGTSPYYWDPIGYESCLQTASWLFESATVVNSYGAAFDDLTVDVGVSIAGVSFEFLWFLSGTDMDAGTTETTWEWAGSPTQFAVSGVGDFDLPGGVQTASQLAIAGSTKTGSGSRFTLSGSIGGATITSYTYFNLGEHSLNAVLTGEDSLENELKLSGVTYLLCEGCDIFWSSEYLLLEGFSLFNDCLEVDAAISFDCCGFGGVDILFKDILLGAFGVDFDFLVSFTTTAKTMTLRPEIELVGACIDLIVDISGDITAGGNTLNGIEILGLSYSQDFGGVDVGFAATWDYTENPLVGSYGYLMHTYAGAVYYWIPDTRGRDLTAAANPVVDSSGAGYWNLTSTDCLYDVAYVYNRMTLGIDGDSCCGGLFDVNVTTYFGEVTQYALEGIHATYYFSDSNTTFELDFLGTGNQFELGTGYVAADDAFEAWDAADNAAIDDCDTICPAADVLAYESVLIDEDYTATAQTGKIFGWVASDIDLSFAVGSGVTLTLGADVRWWGWNTLDFGITFEW